MKDKIKKRGQKINEGKNRKNGEKNNRKKAQKIKVKIREGKNYRKN